MSLPSRGVMPFPKRTACRVMEQWLPIISNNKKPPLPPVKAWASLPALTFWVVMLHFASISEVFISYHSHLATGKWPTLLHKGLSALVKCKLTEDRGNVIHCTSHQLHEYSRYLYNLKLFFIRFKTAVCFFNLHFMSSKVNFT